MNREEFEKTHREQLFNSILLSFITGVLAFFAFGWEAVPLFSWMAWHIQSVNVNLARHKDFNQVLIDDVRAAIYRLKE